VIFFNLTDGEAAGHLGRRAIGPTSEWCRSFGGNAMRHVLASVLASVSALSLFITLCASASAATAHRPSHLRARQPVVVPQGATAPRFAVPGWSDGDTERWLDNASSSWTRA
jgi:hypothetical protein